jgi:tetratricopeptide (TPR) repeat protein
MAYRNIGFIYSEKKDVDRAIEFFLKAEKISKDDYTLIDCLARLYMKKGDYKKALSEYEKALRLNVQDFMFYNGLASAYISNHKFKEAEKALLYSLALNSRQWMAHNRLGNLYSMLGYFELALGEYAKALNIDPHNKGILDNIEKIKKIF